jgi:hypothetical protein
MAFSQIKEYPLFEERYLQALREPNAPKTRHVGFLDQPGEIRNQVYRLALTRQEPINGVLTKLPAIGLLRVCKKVHEEASSILYQENTFIFGIKINWSTLQRIGLYGFPPRLAIWPAASYHQWLRKLHIQISFTPGSPIDFEAPSFLQNDIQAMRRAYDACWDDLEITYDLREGNAHSLTFTMAWLKFRFFEPIAHPKCVVRTGDNVPALVRWCLERTLQQRDLKRNLCEEQYVALREAREIAEDSYSSGMHRHITDLSLRLVWGSPFETTPTPSIFQFGAIFGPPSFRKRIHDKRTMYRQIENSMTDHKATEILLEDNELRALAALELPHEKDLFIKECSELRIYFALQEAAMKITALTSSFGL